MAPKRSNEPADATHPSNVRPDKRLRVSTKDRKRVDVACANCRRLKEKCDGHFPCERCQKYHRPCERRHADQRGAASPHESESIAGERVELLEAIARHYLREDSLDTASLRHVVRTLGLQSGRDIERTGDSGATSGQSELNRVFWPVDEVSHEGFSKRVCDQVNIRIPGSKVECTVSPLGPISPQRLSFDRGVLPPLEIARFLCNVYLEHAQTIGTVVEREWMNSNIEKLYDFEFDPQTADAAWICTALLVLAIGALFSPMAAGPDHANNPRSVQDTNDERETGVAYALNDAGSKLLATVVSLGNAEAARALFMLAQFAISTGSHELAHTYLGCCLDVLERSEMHVRYLGFDPIPDTHCHLGTIGQLALIWKTRLSTLHGNSTCIGLSGNSAVATSNVRTESTDNESIFLNLAIWLHTFAGHFNTLSCRNTTAGTSPFDDLRRDRLDYKRWWSMLSTSETPVLQLNRRTAHLHLIHYLNLVFVGRPFILIPLANQDNPRFVSLSPQDNNSFIEEAEYAAYSIIDICSMLDRAHGLAKFSYIESSSCMAAVMVMVAQSLRGRCHLFREKLELGINLMKKLAPNKNHTSSIQAVHEAVEQLPTTEETKQATNGYRDFEETNQYLNFKTWASSLGRGATGGQISCADAGNEQHSFQELDWDSFGDSIFNLDSDRLDEIYNFSGGSFLPSPLPDATQQVLGP